MRAPLWTSRWPVVVATALVVLSAVFAATAGWAWWASARAREVARDDALRAGEQAVVAFNTLDSRRAEEGFDRWLAISTGALHDDLARQRGDAVRRLAGTAAATGAGVLDAAVTELDEVAGTAVVIASVEVEISREGAPPGRKVDRIEARLVRTGAGWKLGAIGQVAVAAP
ncbi:hypothetical protein ABT337_24260 [Saccharopolyspora hirsuta]|uniref:hypothetical protein n=1 Tax=Saccharopolyspora hirsuta TaxID=1837 RepID=UPI00332F80FE